MIRTIGLVALLFVVVGVGGTARAADCTADVEHISTKVADYGKKLINNFRVQHDAGTSELATVYFEYAVHYLHNGKEFVERGIFRELIRGAGKQYTDTAMATFKVEDILSVDIDDISCRD